MADLRLDNVTKRFGQLTAVDSLSLEVLDGEFFCILGPPGAGKTTTLRLILGLEKPDEGDILIDGEVVNHIHPRKRDIAMIFQNLALYPDKTVFDNIAFSLRERKVPAQQIREQVTSVATNLHIEKLLDRKPGKLSGGERQRVAIARLLVRKPRLYLFDEPLANLDALLRVEMRVELRRLQDFVHQTMVYVTSDHEEALSMADRIAVLNRGVLQQCDTPDRIYNFPANRLVATIVGSPPMNFIPCRLCKQDGSLEIVHSHFTLCAEGESHPLLEMLDDHSISLLDGQILVGVRPEDLLVSDRPFSERSFPAEISVVEPLGPETILDIRVGKQIIKAIVPPTQKVFENQHVWLDFNMEKIHFLDDNTGIRVYTNTTCDTLNCYPVSEFKPPESSQIKELSR